MCVAICVYKVFHQKLICSFPSLSPLFVPFQGALVHAVVKQNPEIVCLYLSLLPSFPFFPSLLTSFFLNCKSKVQLLIDNKVNLDTGAIKPYARFPLHASVSRFSLFSHFPPPPFPLSSPPLLLLTKKKVCIMIKRSWRCWWALEQASTMSMKRIGVHCTRL